MLIVLSAFTVHVVYDSVISSISVTENFFAFKVALLSNRILEIPESPSIVAVDFWYKSIFDSAAATKTFKSAFLLNSNAANSAFTFNSALLLSFSKIVKEDDF